MQSIRGIGLSGAGYVGMLVTTDPTTKSVCVMGLFWQHFVPKDEYAELWRHMHDLVEEWPQACLFL